MSRALSIVFLSHTASPDSPTGAERSLALLAAGLRRRGHRSCVVVPGPWALRAMAEAEGVEVVRIRSRSCWLTYYEPRPPVIAALKWIQFAVPPGNGRSVRRFLRDRDPDIVHVNCLPHVSGADAARRSGRPVVWHVREILPGGLRRRWFAHRLDRDADAVIAVSEAVAGWIRAENVGCRLDVVHNGIARGGPLEEPASARRALDIAADGVLIGLYGQLAPHKGGVEFIEAAVLALERCPDLRFVLAGAGPEDYVRRVDAAIRASAHSGRIRRLPPQPDTERLLAAADVVALTTMTPDPLPRAALEGMAAGRPVVAWRSGGIAEMVVTGETGVLVDGGDVEGLARAFVEVGSDAELRNRMGAAARRRAAERFSLERHLDRMESVFRDLT